MFVAAVAAAPASAAGALPSGPGKAVVQRVCTSCHGTETFANTRMSRDEWRLTVDQMVSRGAKATPAEKRSIVDYLTRYMGAPAKRATPKKTIR